MFCRKASRLLQTVQPGVFVLAPTVGAVRDRLIRLLETRDRRDVTQFGLVWEANESERDKALNADLVALDTDPASYLANQSFFR